MKEPELFWQVVVGALKRDTHEILKLTGPNPSDELYWTRKALSYAERMYREEQREEIIDECVIESMVDAYMGSRYNDDDKSSIAFTVLVRFVGKEKANELIEEKLQQHNKAGVL